MVRAALGMFVQADRMDATRRPGDRPHPIAGVPVLVKDNVETGDLTRCTAGSLALRESRPAQREAAVIERLRSKGGIVLGKTNLSEWANFRSTNSISGWSAGVSLPFFSKKKQMHTVS